MSAEEQNGGRTRAARLSVFIAAGALPLLVSCSSSSSVEYATDAFPSQSLVDLLKESKNPPPPPAPSAGPPAPAATDVSLPAPAAAPPPARDVAPASAAAAVTPPPAATASAENDDPVAAAFPSVSLIDLVSGRKSGSQ